MYCHRLKLCNDHCSNMCTYKKCFILHLHSSLFKNRKLLEMLLPWKILQNLLGRFFHIVLFYIYKKSNSTIEEKTTWFPNSKNLK